MMNFLQRISMAASRFMIGRNGPDPLSITTLVAGLVMALLGSITGAGILTLLSFALYIWTIFRMLSKNTQKRAQELAQYEALREKVTAKVGPMFRRLKNSKEYRYFRCPACKTMLRMRRGRGQVEMVCPKCGHAFKTHS